MAFDPWSYEQPIGEGMCTINALSYSAALADYQAGEITEAEFAQVADLFGQTRVCGSGGFSFRAVIVDELAYLFPLDLELGTEIKVAIGGENISAFAIQMGIVWDVSGPDWWVRQHYIHWKSALTDPGGVAGFVGPALTLDELGTWNILVYLMVHEADPRVLASYDGDLCVVAAVPVSAGRIIRKELDYDAVRVPFPVP